MYSVLQLIFINKVNFLQVYNKLEVSRTSTSFEELFLYCMATRPVLRSLLCIGEKSNAQEVFPVLPVIFKLFSSLLLECAVFSTSTFVTLRFGLFTESQEEWNFS